MVEGVSHIDDVLIVDFVKDLRLNGVGVSVGINASARVSYCFCMLPFISQLPHISVLEVASKVLTVTRS